MALAGYEAHGLLTGALALCVGAPYGTGDGHAPRLLDPPDRHAEVIGLDDDDGAPGPQPSVQGIGDLGRKTLLELGAAGVALHHPGQLGQPHDLTVGYVADVGFADHRQEMMLTGRIEGDVSDEGHLVVILLKTHA